MREALVDLLNAMLMTHAPTGREDEMDAFLRERLQGLGADVEQDAHGNLLVWVAGRESGPATAVAAHKDELAVLIRRIDGDGKIWVEPLGGCRPHKYGEGPFDVITDRGVVEGVLCLGSTHSSALSSRTDAATRRMPDWDVVYVDCGLNGAGLAAAGVQIGDRALPGRRRKAPMGLGPEALCGYGLDDKAGVAILLLLLERLLAAPPRHDVLVAFTSSEESGCSGALYLGHSQDVDDLIAVEIAPIAEEYPVVFDERPVLLYKDSIHHYDLSLTRAIAQAAAGRGIGLQAQCVRSFGSDAGAAKKAGMIGRAACIAFPTQNTHGYEIGQLGAMENCVRVLEAYLL
ncbi:MAG: M20/M25/M40 family metallo-hydrolase [Lentisphaerae bacterium]|nr:M20/M25/M40 family metallo-hydrolase [Lentisphaerota bacterium]